ncbi:unnamed protein product [Penicillium salamii]|nr:unnamed protein product [Penicillium salamii]CAG8365357.1 unnamed protein product [Penicillium salamii]
MPICIECSYPVSHLYSAYSRADDRSQGKGVRLTQCPRCQRFADKYVEHDFVVLFIDLVLIKPQRSIIRLGVLLLLFDVYLTWARIEKDPSLATTFLSRAPIIVQYLFFLSLNAAATLAHHLTVRLLASLLVPKSRRHVRPDASKNVNPTLHPGDPVQPSGPTTPTMRPSPSATPGNTQSQLSNPPASPLRPPPTPTHPEITSPDPPPTPLGSTMAPPRPTPLRRTSTAPLQNIQSLPPPTTASPAAISTALLVSSCAKLFPILLVIWGADGSGSLSDSHTLTGSQIRSPRQPATMPSAVHQTLFANSRTKSALSVVSALAPGTAPVSFRESWVAATASLLRNSGPTSYLAGIFDMLASLLSLGVVDTHLVLLSNIVAIYILLGCGYLRAVTIAVAGQVARWAVQKVILGAVGVG